MSQEMRDRLVELLKQANQICAKKFREETKAVLKQKGCFNSRTDRAENFNEITADYLIANGVIVPPCKVGDSIYKVVKPKNSNVSDGWIVEQKVAGFHMGEIPSLRGIPRRDYFIIFHEATQYIDHIPFDKLGKTIFLTKEEAEKALEG